MNGYKQDRRQTLQRTIGNARPGITLIALVLACGLFITGLDHARGSPSAVAGSSGASGYRDFLRNPLLYFSQRSPGPRGSGPLLQTKASKKIRSASNPLDPYEQA